MKKLSFDTFPTEIWLVEAKLWVLQGFFPAYENVPNLLNQFEFLFVSLEGNYRRIEAKITQIAFFWHKSHNNPTSRSEDMRVARHCYQTVWNGKVPEYFDQFPFRQYFFMVNIGHTDGNITQISFF